MTFMHRGTLLLLIFLVGCATPEPRVAQGIDRAEFAALLERLSDGWSSGDARTAVECFAVEAIYVEPPQKQVYRGREQLFQFFGGESGRRGAMQMRWHRIVFDEGSQRGMAEFTFRYGEQVHGVVVIDVANGLIAQWREYWYSSELPFDEFVAPSAP